MNLFYWKINQKYTDNNPKLSFHIFNLSFPLKQPPSRLKYISNSFQIKYSNHFTDKKNREESFISEISTFHLEVSTPKCLFEKLKLEIFLNKYKSNKSWAKTANL